MNERRFYLLLQILADRNIAHLSRQTRSKVGLKLLSI